MRGDNQHLPFQAFSNQTLPRRDDRINVINIAELNGWIDQLQRMMDRIAREHRLLTRRYKPKHAVPMRVPMAGLDT